MVTIFYFKNKLLYYVILLHYINSIYNISKNNNFKTVLYHVDLLLSNDYKQRPLLSKRFLISNK